METIKNYIESNKDRFLEELFELIRIPSISSRADHKPEMYKAAENLGKRLLEAAADKTEIFETAGHPVLYGEKLIDDKLPTVLVYGHYDVQPVEPLDLWVSPPFEPEIRDGKIYARGADDDKGQLYMNVKAFEYLVSTNQLKCNVKFMFEGEEEVGSPSLGKFCEDHKEMLKSDIILVSDTSLLGEDTPSITVGLRGLAYLEVEVTGPNRDLHSGLFGGAVANPINILSKMITSLKDENNHITIPGFYDKVEEVSPENRAELNKAPFCETEYRNALDVEELHGEEGYTTLERIGIRPTLDVCGIWGGYTGEGAKTVLPSKAYAKVSMRLVPGQNSVEITKLFTEHFESMAPKHVKVKVTNLHGGEGYVAPTDTKAYQAASSAMESVFGIKPVPYRSGGSIPIISLFEKVLDVKSILMGFGLDSDAIHSPNENYPVANFCKGIEALTYFYQNFSEKK